MTIRLILFFFLLQSNFSAIISSDRASSQATVETVVDLDRVTVRSGSEVRESSAPQAITISPARKRMGQCAAFCTLFATGAICGAALAYASMPASEGNSCKKAQDFLEACKGKFQP